MSLEYYLIRSAHVNRNTTHLTSLFNQLNIQQAESIKPSIRKPQILAEFSQSDINVNGMAHFLAQKSKFVQCKYPKEPYSDLRCWIIFDHLNRTIEDLSLFGNHAVYETGYPCLTIGEDNGLYSHNLATILNREKEILEYYRISHNSTIDYADTDFSSGFTLLLIFKPYCFFPESHQEPTVYQKMNDTTATGGVSVRMGLLGNLKVFVRSASTDYNFITEPAKLRIMAYNTAVITYDPLATPRIAVQINGENMTDSADETPEWSADPASKDAYFGIGNNQIKGKAWMALQEFRQYKVALTETQCRNLFRNKLTIESYVYGQPAWLGYCRFPDASTDIGFDDTTYDSVAFDTS